MCELGLKLQKREVGYCGRYSEWGGSSVCLRCRLDGKGGAAKHLCDHGIAAGRAVRGADARSLLK